MEIHRASPARATIRRGSLVLLVACALGSCFEATSSHPGTALRELVEVAGPLRPVEPRLSAFEVYAPCCTGFPENQSPAVEAASELETALLADRATRGEASRSGHVQGLYHLLWIGTDGADEDAVEELEATVVASPPDAELWSDLAAAYLVRARRAEDPLDLLHALELLERGLELAPELPEARFNRALALERLQLQDLARDAWRAYLELDATSGWAEEASAHLARSTPPELREAWDGERPRLVAAIRAGDAVAVREMVDRFRKPARLWGEDELLGAWAKARRNGDSAAADHLASARAIGSALAELTGDHLLADAVAAIDRAANEPPVLRRLVDGHLAYARGLELIFGAGEDLGQARQALARAVARLAPESPFALRARFHDLRSAGRMGEREECVRLGRTLAAEAAATGRYPVIEGRALWVAGTSLVVLGRLGEAETAYLAALERFRDGGEIDSRVAVGMNLASVTNEFGDVRETWRRNLETLRVLREHRLPRRERLMLTIAAFSAAELGETRVALLFAEAGLKLAREQLDTGLAGAGSVATHLWHRAYFRRLLGRFEAALEDTAEARRYHDLVVSEDDRRTLRPEILLEEARSLAGRDPRGALARLDEAEKAFRTSQTAYPAPSLLRERARILVGLGKLDTASAALDEAIEILDRQRDQVERPGHQLSFFDRTGEVYDDLLALELRRGASPEALLQTAEGARSRVLLDWLFDLGSAPERTLRNTAARRPFAVEELLARLPPVGVVLGFEVLEDRLLTWVARDGDVHLEVSDIDADHLAAAVEAFRESVRVGRSAPDSAELWRLLIAPIHSRIADRERLVIAADGVLHGLPFAALRDIETGRFLVEDHVLSFVPGLQAFLELEERASKLPPIDLASARYLVVADPAFDPGTFHLERLEGARREALAIEARFDAVERLAGPEATPSALRDRLGSAEVFHYAGHALANWRSPLRSSLVLAPEPAGESRGELFAHAILGLDLDRTRLVVLSACETAYGGQVSREGVIGLVWPFLARGVPAVVATLWRVDDVEAASLMTNFYDALAAGLDPAAALRAAQLAQQKTERTFGWAAMQIFGTATGRED